MFPNLDAEMARKRMTDEKAAQLIGITRSMFCRKKKSGKFYVTEAFKLCEFFGVPFDYLFKAG